MVVRFWRAAAFATLVGALGAQVIQFESGGLKYQTLSKNGVTVMFAHLHMHLHDYSILQAGILNGSQETFTVRPENFSFRGEDGTVAIALPAPQVVDHLLVHASPSDVVKLISAYEAALNGLSQMRSTNGYESRRQTYLAASGSSRLKAAAAASAIAFVATKLSPGESTDGAVFFELRGKALEHGRLTVHAGSGIFEFDSEPAGTGKTLQTRPDSSTGPN